MTTPEQQPVRLTQGKFGPLLRRASAEFEAGADEPAAFRRLSSRLGETEPRSSRRVELALAISLAIFCVATLSRWQAHQRAESTPRVAAETTHAVQVWKTTSPNPKSSPSSLQLSRGAESALRVGNQVLADGSQVTLRDASVAHVSRDSKGTHVALLGGTLEVRVAKQPKSQVFDVNGGNYRFEALGTQFRVRVGAELVSLEVQEGTVAVWRGSALLGRIEAGERWDSRARTTRSNAPPSASASASAALPASAPLEGPDCLSFARSGATRAAEECFRTRAQGSGIGAEMALYEVARLRRDVLGDANGALSALSEYRRRFPGGSLRREAEMSELELLVQLGRSDAALTLSAELLAASGGRERASELHLLRGHILRKSGSGLRAAASEYELAERASGRASSEATYYRALCLQLLGDEQAALHAFERYLAEPGGHAEDARKRMEKLSQ